jgi:hypothetical protein
MGSVNVFSSVVSLDGLGAISTAAPVSVDSTGATSLNITAGKKGIIIQNIGSNIVWFGGSNVSPGTNYGCCLLPMVMLVLYAKSNFTIYFKTAAGLTSTVGVVEFG